MKQPVHTFLTAMILGFSTSSFAGACLDGGGSLSPAQMQKTMDVISKLIHPDDKNTIAYVRECYTMPLKTCQMAVDLTLHVSGSDKTPHMTWRIGKANDGIHTSQVRTMHIFPVDDKYGFVGYDTGKGNMNEPCDATQ